MEEFYISRQREITPDYATRRINDPFEPHASNYILRFFITLVPTTKLRQLTPLNQYVSNNCAT
jgi:hypothetical protein